MAITNQYGDREYQKFVESTTVSGQLGVVVLNPDGTPISAGGGGGGTTQYADGTAVSVSTVGIVNMGSDGSNLHFLSSNSSGELNLNNIGGTISLPTGAATEVTLSSVDTSTTSIDTKLTTTNSTLADIETDTSSIDTKLTTTNNLLTDIETNTDILANITDTTIGSDVGLDVNLINQVDNLADSNNSTTSALLASATFTGTGTDVSEYTSITVTLSTDQDSATDGMKFQFSTDNTNWDDSYNFTYDVSIDGTARRFQFPVTAQYFRVVFENGSTDQTHLRIQTILHRNNVLTSIHKIDGTLYGDRSATLVKAVIAGETSAGSGTNFVNVKVAPSGAMEVNANQDTHDSLNANANIQVGDTDVSNANPVPVSDAGGSLTVDNAALTELEGAINASSQLDVNIAADAVGLATETTLSSVDTKLTTTNSKLTDIETNTDSLAGVTQTTIGSDTGLDVNIIAGGGTGGGDQYVDGYTLVSGEKGNVMLGSDGTNLQFLDVNSSGQLNLNNISGTISLPTGAATEATLLNIYSDTTAIDTSTSSIDTKLTTTNSKLTDIETNTDSLVGITNTTIGADTGLDVNVIGTIDVSIDQANDSILIYGFDGASNQKVATDTSGQLKVSLEADNVGLATETTLTSILADTAAIDTSTASIDTKLTTTNSKLTDIETNTDSLASVTNTTVGAKTGLDVNIIEGVNVEVDLDAADDSVLVYGYDGTSNQKIKTNTSGQLEVSLEVDNVGLATETTLTNVDSTLTSILADTASIDTSTQSIDTKLTTTNAKLTDIETNTDILANLTSTTIGADVGLDANIINTVDVAVSEADDSILIYAWDGTSNQKVKSNTSGQLEVSLEVDNIGLATEATLQSIDTSTQSIDTKLTTTNAKLTDIETNTDILANLTSTTIGADIGLDANIINTVDVAVDQANDSILIYGWDGAANQKVKTNTSGQLEVSIDVDNVGLATESTLSNLDATATLIRADTSSIDTKLTTTNTLLTDIETNTDSLAGVTQTAVGADTGVDVNIINTSLPISLSRVANIQNNQSTGTGNISVNISPGFMFKINAVYLKFQAVPTANDFTISLFDPANPFYNTTLFSVNPGSLGITDVAWVPDGENIILPSQGIDITFTNTATTAYGLTVIYEYIV